MSPAELNAYHVWGALSSLFFCVSLTGIASQLRTVLQRVRAFRAGTLSERPTAILSLNRNTSSFLGFFANYLLAATFTPVDAYLLCTRFLGLTLVFGLLYQVYADRRDRASTIAVWMCALLWGGATLLAIGARPLAAALLPSAQLINVVTAVVLTQGYAHQVALIRRSGSTGAVSKLMFQLLLLKELSTMGFAFTMPLAKSWPIVFLAGTALANELILLWQFHWVRTSSLAAERRSASLAYETPKQE